VMAGFFVPLFLAALLGVVVQQMYRWMLPRCRGYHYVATGITTTVVALIVLLPLGLIVTTATLEALSLVDELQVANFRDDLTRLRNEFGLQIPCEQDVRHIEVTLRAWHDRERSGQPLEIQTSQVKNLLNRVDNITKWLDDHGTEVNVAADATELAKQLARLRDAEAGSVERDEALQLADAEFRKFKRELLGGTYRAWLTELANPNDDQLDGLRSTILSSSKRVLSLGTDTIIFLTKVGFGLLIMMVALFFLLAEGPRMLTAIIAISPLEEQHVRELAAEFDRACRAIVSAMLLSAIVQGVLAGIGFYFCGLRSSVAMLTLLTTVLALVPVTGAAAVWVPVSLYLYLLQGNTTAAVGLAIYGFFIISSADNVVKPLVLHGQSNLHPLLALLSVLGGIQALGPIGLVVGPMAVVFLQTLLKILQRELSSIDRSSWMFWRGFGGPPESVTPAAANVAAVAAATHPRNGTPSDQAAKPEQPVP
ncbi:MAG: AI-2E family transporter, partial [Planctomycetia bacterium]|nr:AI-2E family transporter [Planctomycetia bacterium]